MVNLERRSFLLGAAATAVATMPARPALAAGTAPGSAMGLACKPMEKIRVGMVGIGSRGMFGAQRLLQIPGVEITAAADINGPQFGSLKAAFKKFDREYHVKEYSTPEGYKALAEDPNVDVVYICGPWQLHDAMAIAGVRAGRVVTEANAGGHAPAVVTLRPPGDAQPYHDGMKMCF